MEIFSQSRQPRNEEFENIPEILGWEERVRFDEFRVDIFHAIDTRNYSFNELIDGGKGGTIEKLLVRNHAPRNRFRLGLLRRR